MFGVVSSITYSNGILEPQITIVSSSPVYAYDPSTTMRISQSPFLRDQYEQEQVYVRQSGIPYAGEGLYAKHDIEEGALIALFNGVKIREVHGTRGITSKFTDYKIGLTGEVCLDIPKVYESIEKYRSTLAHKCCHSFSPNAGFADLYHPRFGHIMSVVAKRNIRRTEEVLVSYNYNIYQAGLERFDKLETVQPNCVLLRIVLGSISTHQTQQMSLEQKTGTRILILSQNCRMLSSGPRLVPRPVL